QPPSQLPCRWQVCMSFRPNASTPHAAGYAMPAEWAPHRTCYTAWPAHEYAWGGALRAAQREFCAFVRAFTGEPGQEPLAVEVDGRGTCLSTRSCLQNPNRGPVPSDDAVLAQLRAALGVPQLIWLDAGLANDHTDGHIDNIARFVAEGVVVCMEAHDHDDP